MKILYTLILSAAIATTASAQDTTTVKHHTTTTDSTVITHTPNTPPPPSQAPVAPPAPTPSTTAAPSTDPNANASAPATNTWDNSSRFLLGVRFLPTFTSLTFSKVAGGDVQSTLVLGYGFSGLVGVNFNNYFGLQAEVMYQSLAQRYTEGNKTNEVHLSYVNVPLMMTFNTGYDKPVNFNVAIGPQFGFNTGSSLKSSGTNVGDSLTGTLAVKPADIGFAYGAGLDFNLGPNSHTKLSIGYRGVFGLIDISDRSNNATTNQYYILDRSHVRTYAAYIGITWAI